MARTRALLTEKEREHLASGDTEPGSRRYQVISEVRNRIQDELPHDLDILAKHHPELYNDIKTLVDEHDKGTPHCPECHNEITTTDDDRADYSCTDCNILWLEEDIYYEDSDR